ncbi:MAG: hypothetical protein U1F36_08240 [Planctomycetota bacterium]
MHVAEQLRAVAAEQAVLAQDPEIATARGGGLGGSTGASSPTSLT